MDHLLVATDSPDDVSPQSLLLLPFYYLDPPTPHLDPDRVPDTRIPDQVPTASTDPVSDSAPDSVPDTDSAPTNAPVSDPVPDQPPVVQSSSTTRRYPQRQNRRPPDRLQLSFWEGRGTVASNND